MSERVSRFLVVVADDAGADADRDAGILEAFDRGVVRCASVLANGPTAEAFVEAARSRHGLGLGLHVNLTEGAALAGPAPSLTDAAGRFPGDKREVWRRAAAGLIRAEDVRREFLAQWGRLATLVGDGARLDHVDGHHHVHVLPGVLDGVIDGVLRGGAEARRGGRRAFLRLPAECGPPAGAALVERPGLPFPDPDVARISDERCRQRDAGHTGIAALGAWSDLARPRLPSALRVPDAFLGLAFSAEPSVARFTAGVREARGEVVEVMVHPGRVTSASRGFSADPRRDLERRFLCDPALAAEASAAGFALARFGDVP